LQGKNPNPLYDLKEKNQMNYGRTQYNTSINQNMSYNPNYGKQTHQYYQNNLREEPPDSVPKYKINTNPFPSEYNNNQINILEDNKEKQKNIIQNNNISEDNSSNLRESTIKLKND
jgi:hypothetical protein